MGGDGERPRFRQRYEPTDLLGRGGQGEVWRAFDHQHDRVVALKTRRLEQSADADAALAEARVLLELRPHECLPLVRDDFIEFGQHVIVMDFIDGADLRSRMSAGDGPLPHSEAIEHLERVADALEHLHSHLPVLCHGDVKPANVVVGEHGAILVDLGLAPGAHAAYAHAGTAGFVAPEVAAGLPRSPAADVFALAAMAHVLLTGALPRPGVRNDLPTVAEEHRALVTDALHAGLATMPSARPGPRALIDAMRPPTAPSNLPAPLTSFVGRGVELAELAKLLDGARCVTIVGPGGVGKTRIALEVARRRRSAYPGGAWYVDLAGVRRDGDVVAAINADLVIEPTGAPLDDLLGSLRAGRCLLVLDTCEHLLDAVAALAETVLEGCGELTVLLTSRETVRVAGEHVFELESLNSDDGLQLLDERARATGVSDTVGEYGQALVDALDRLPLAIELAAARIKDLGPKEVLDGLADRLALLSQGPRAHARHRTIEATIDWSYRLLTDDARTCLRRISVFAGPFREDAVAEVAGDAADALATVVRSSLVSAESPAPDGMQRYRLLDTVRDFATARFEIDADIDAIKRDFGNWALGFVQAAEDRRARAEDQVLQVALVEAEYRNILEVLAIGGLMALRMADISWGIWRSSGRSPEAARHLAAALEEPQGASVRDLVSSRQKLAVVLAEQGETARAEELLEQAAAAIDETCSTRLIAAVHNSLGILAAMRGDLERAGDVFVQGSRLVGDADPEARGSFDGNLANVRMLQGRLDEARELLTSLVERNARDGQRSLQINHTIMLGELEGRVNDWAAAEHRYLDALRLIEGTGILLGAPIALLGIAVIWARTGNLELAACAWGAAQEELTRTGAVVPEGDRPEFEQLFDSVSERLSESLFDALVDAGRVASIKDVVSLAPVVPDAER